MSDDDAVLLDVEDGVATLTVNRPDVRNALTHEVSQGILDALDEVEGSDARCLVVTGAGANLAVACDVQLASEESKISFGFRQVGLAVDTGTSYFLPRIVGENTAKELVFTGELVEADRAESLGLFNHVYPESEFDEQADEFVEEIATGPTVALKTSKRLVGQGFESSLDQAMENEAAAQAAVFETHDHREGAESFMGREEPDFEGR
ncbi:enoyl-CoA hydratase/isomerase family protein [Halococcus sp. IIIV-5B]|uniref:enoyl-CoA hydratase/isomerase family protein n=1 Tax=Halococcus sp. IIIV-5B TaxID=2321230 RepID=UPI000E737CCC|nr:enoyl-CoA hydratase-related protein [Halococcus sp. IIIV-5B]RJT01159.1 enoyl-CoA hydratase [Halococcus sp. IIIV-5B]